MNRTIIDFRRWNELSREQSDIEARLTATVAKSADLMWTIMVKKFGHSYDWESLPNGLRWVVWFRKTGKIQINQYGIYVTREPGSCRSGAPALAGAGPAHARGHARRPQAGRRSLQPPAICAWAGRDR